jgi:uncharacterized protein (UPF0548 family)
MPLRLRRPTEEQLLAAYALSVGAALTYEPVGLSTLAEQPPAGYRFDAWARALGSTDDTFGAAADALRGWSVHRGAGLIVLSDGPPTVGEVVAMSAPLPVGYVDAVCRVVAVTDEPDRYAFTYGTLPDHPEQGEESFAVERAADGEVTFRIVAVWRARHPLARVCPPIARRLQRSATERYLETMDALVDR